MSEMNVDKEYADATRDAVKKSTISKLEKEKADFLKKGFTTYVVPYRVRREELENEYYALEEKCYHPQIYQRWFSNDICLCHMPLTMLWVQYYRRFSSLILYMKEGENLLLLLSIFFS